MELTTRDLRHLARLARLEVPRASGDPLIAERAETLRGSLEHMLAYLRQLPEGTSRQLPEGLPLGEHREDERVTAWVDPVLSDEPAPCLDSERVLTNAPARHQAWIRVPRPAGHGRLSTEDAPA